jgi:hypothetical protein|tara:strand:- start:8022 stop:10040 length:2019 start_codon:yes stop_codon:yes gene_type:complete
LSGASGEIFFDADRGTLRLYTANQAENIIIADRAWVLANTFSGDYSTLTNVPPSAVTDVSQLGDSSALFFDRDYNSLTNLPNLDDLVTDISTIGVIGDVNISGTPESGQLLVWDGSIWVNQTVAGFVDTNTTYDVSASATAAGAQILLTDDDTTTTTVELVGGTGINLAITDTNEITIAANAVTLSLNDLSNTSITNVQDTQTLVYSSGQWINTSDVGGLGFDDFTVTVAGESGTGNLSYNTGAFTYTPPDLNSFVQLSAFSVTVDSAQSGGSLSYDDVGGFTFRPANLSGYSQLTDLSVTTDGTPAGGGSLSYNNSSGEFTFVPADVSSGGGGDVVDDTSPQLGGDLDVNNYQIQSTSGNVVIAAAGGAVSLTGDTGDMSFTNTGSGIFSFAGTVNATTFTSSGSGAPVLTSASTITLEAPDGVIITGGASGGTFRLPSFTTTQKNALTAANGDIIYDSTTSQAQVYEGSWTSISGGGGITLADARNGLSVTQASASGTGALSYANASGAFTYTPPDTSSFLTSVPAQTFASLTGTPTTLSGYGITDGLSAGATPMLSEVSSTINGATGTVVHNTTTSGVFYHTAPAANFTANFTNVPTTGDRITTVALIIAQGLTQYMPTAVQIGGAAQTIEWFGGSVPGGTANGFDIVSFTLIRQSSTWTVLGASSTYG